MISWKYSNRSTKISSYGDKNQPFWNLECRGKDQESFYESSEPAPRDIKATKARTTRNQFVNMHSVHEMWLKSAALELNGEFINQGPEASQEAILEKSLL